MNNAGPLKRLIVLVSAVATFMIAPALAEFTSYPFYALLPEILKMAYEIALIVAVYITLKFVLTLFILGGER